MAAEYAPQKRRVALVSLVFAGGSLGVSLGTFISTFLMENFHWTLKFIALGAPALIVTVLLFLFMPESLDFLTGSAHSPRRKSLSRALDPENLVVPIEMVATVNSVAKTIPFRDLITDGRAGGTASLGLILFFSFAVFNVITTLTPLMLRQLDTWVLVLVFNLYNLVFILGSAIAGWLVNWFGPVRFLVPLFIGEAVLLAGLGYFASSPFAVTAIMLLLGFATAAGVASTIALAVTFYPTAMRSTGTGWVVAMGRFGMVCSGLASSLLASAALSPGRIMTVTAIAPLLAGLSVLLKKSFVQIEPKTIVGSGLDEIVSSALYLISAILFYFFYNGIGINMFHPAPITILGSVIVIIAAIASAIGTTPWKSVTGLSVITIYLLMYTIVERPNSDLTTLGFIFGPGAIMMQFLALLLATWESVFDANKPRAESN